MLLCSIVNAAVRHLDTTNLKHLRRFVKAEHLPSSLNHLVELAVPSSFSIEPAGPQRSATVHTSNTAHPSTKAPSQTVQESFLCFLVCATSVITYEDLRELLSSIDQLSNSHFEPRIGIIPVPLNPPTSESQAKHWSQEYWPTVYKGGNQFGAHSAIVARATEEIENHVAYFMGLAMRVGLATSSDFKGEPMGAIVVDRSGIVSPVVVVAAGDARWNYTREMVRQDGGNAMAHSAMRAIGLVAKKRQIISGDRQAGLKDNVTTCFADEPLTLMERDIYATTSLVPGGYLCLDLELYLTHEPCLMCSMAILHSRFSRVVFGQRMPLTGGFGVVSPNHNFAEIDNHGQFIGYGLFWRPELNWKLLAWQWIDGDSSESSLCLEDIHA